MEIDNIMAIFVDGYVIRGKYTHFITREERDKLYEYMPNPEHCPPEDVDKLIEKIVLKRPNNIFIDKIRVEGTENKEILRAMGKK